jgi:hypothetical protein
MIPGAKLAITIGAVFLAGCGWERKLVFTSPSTHESVEIDQPFPINGAGIRVLLNANRTSKTLYELRVDAFLDFATVVWSSAGDVAVFTCGTPPLRLAYSAKDSQPIPFASMEASLVSDLRKEYELGASRISDKGVLEWACSSDGKREFLRHHPDAKPH